MPFTVAEFLEFARTHNIEKICEQDPCARRLVSGDERYFVRGKRACPECYDAHQSASLEQYPVGMPGVRR